MADLPALLLLHGVGDSGDCWGPFLRALDLPGLVVQAPSAAAHGGRLASPGHDLSKPNMIAEATALAEQMAAQSPAGLVIGGHSMGSSIALATAAARPELFRGLFLEDPPFDDVAADQRAQQTGEHELPVHLGGLADWIKGLQMGTVQDAIAGARADHPDWDPAEYEPWARAKLSMDVTAFDSSKPWVVGGWTSLATQVRCPVLVVAGDPDRGGLTSMDAEQFLRDLAGWQVHRAPGAGHDVRRDATAQTTALLREFLTNLVR